MRDESATTRAGSPLRRGPTSTLICNRGWSPSIGTRRARLHARHVRKRHVSLEDLLGHDDPERGIERGGATGQQRGLAGAGRAGDDDRRTGVDTCREERRGALVEHPGVDELGQITERNARELADVHDEVTTARDVAVDYVQPSAAVELRVLQTFRWIELAVCGRRVVEDLGERAEDVLVVVEDLVVVAGRPAVSGHEHRVRPVDHDLPHVIVGKQRFQGAVAGEVAEGPVDHQVGGGQVERASAVLEVQGPAGDLVGEAYRVARGRCSERLAGTEADEAGVEEIRQKYGLDDPVLVQYLRWVGLALRGDLGESIRTREPVAAMVAGKLPITLQLAALSVLVAVAIAIPAGVLAAVRRNTVWDFLATSVSLCGVSIPNFWLGILVILALLHIFSWSIPVGYVSPIDDPIRNFKQLVFPVLVLGTALSATVSPPRSVSRDRCRPARPTRCSPAS